MDPDRHDGRLDHICCSVEYPNSRFFYVARRDRRGNKVFENDWAILLIDRKYLWADGTKFTPINASTSSSLARPMEGVVGLRAMFEQRVRRKERDPNQLACTPTDVQAEVLIPNRVPSEDLIGLAVRDEEQVAREAARLKLLGVPIPEILIAPAMYNSRILEPMIRSGQRPEERTFGGLTDEPV